MLFPVYMAYEIEEQLQGLKHWVLRNPFIFIKQV